MLYHRGQPLLLQRRIGGFLKELNLTEGKLDETLGASHSNGRCAPCLVFTTRAENYWVHAGLIV